MGEQLLPYVKKIRYIPTSLITIIIKCYSEVKDYILDLSPDIIHSQAFRADLLLSQIKRRNWQSISTLHSYFPKDYPYNLFGYWFGNILAFIHIRAINKLNHLIACSKYLDEKYKKHNVQISKTILNGIEVKFFDLKDITEFKSTFFSNNNIPLKSIIWITGSRLVRGKNIQTIVVAFSKFIINNKLSNHYLLIVGNGKEEKKLQTLSINNQNIIFINQLKHIHFLKLLECSDYFISSSLTEGCPISVLESISANIKVILSDIKPHMEIINHHKHIRSFVRNNIKDLVKVMETSLNAGAQSNKLFDRYFAKTMSAEYQNKYKEMIIKSL